MNVGSIGGGLQMPQLDPSQMRQHAQKAMAPVADLLGVSSSELQSKLAGGETLSSLASAKGVSRDDLVAAVQKGLKADAPNGVSVPSGLAEKIADGKMPGRPPATGVAGPTGLNSLADLLGTDTDSVLDQLKNGTSPSQLANGSNRTLSEILDALKGGVQINQYA